MTFIYIHRHNTAALSLNAVNAKGEKYGVMDDSTNKGMPPEKFAGALIAP